jgi:FimV-like protein
MRLHHIVFCFFGLSIAFAADGSFADYSHQALSTTGVDSSKMSPDFRQAESLKVKPAPAHTPTKTIQEALLRQQNILQQQQNQLSHLQKRIDILTNENKSFQQMASQQMSDDSKNIAHLSAQMNSFLEKLSTQSNAAQPIKVSQPNSPQNANAFVKTISSDWHEVMMYKMWLAAATVSILLLCCILLWSKRSKKLSFQRVKETSANLSGSSDDEFDFLNSQEGMTAKLDLARAYDAMQDYAQMREVLNDIVENGDAQQKQQAQLLLDGIPQ